MKWPLALLALALSCAPVSLDRGEPTDGRTDFMRAGGRTGNGSGGSGPAGSGGAPVGPQGSGGGGGPSGNGGQSAGEGGAGGASEPPDATPEDLRDAKILPPLRDAAAANCNNLPDWKAGFLYQPGNSVVHTTPRRRFKCRPWPNSGWCSMPEYEPNGPKGHWPDAWIDEGVCP